jgi:hypothetical protein
MPKKHNALSRSDNAETSRPTSGPSYGCSSRSFDGCVCFQ